MEIVDALTVLGRPGWQQIELTIERTAERTFVSQLVETRGDWHAQRADLGLDPVEVRASLDEAVTDLLKIRTDFVTVLRVDRASQDESEVLLSALDATGSELFACALDARMLEHRVFTEALFATALAAADKIDAQQRWLAVEALGHDDWEYDSRYAHLVLKKGVLPWRSFSAQVVGSWAKEGETFLWAWANQELPPAATVLSRAVKQQSLSDKGLGVLRRAHIPADEAFASALSRLATARSDAACVYPAVHEQGVIYLAIHRVIEAR
jgi:hypothetical protein